ncbi:large-conductance mechanosensitive channel protein MscL [Agreia pratensis]|uniref:large-conductance mechanosensitive channel protein MscL n=1 Tax=Agreia pratensis TaxID=150121 RepID=UPI00188A1E0A|nr:large-conductance mechanosensitive channel protein MscL [Agreia pratensis]MBF4635599.1 large-conductance mechanosensitive channel protein MscL [Agreia pratensis]
MLKGFKEFVLRGNVIDLAVAVVIGAAFTAVVTAIVTNVFTPLIGALFKAKDLESAFVIDLGGGSKIMLGAVLAAVIQFLIVAVVVYFVFVLPINHLKKMAFIKKRQPTPEETVETPPTEAELLTEIRDLLAKQQASSSGPTHPTA